MIRLLSGIFRPALLLALAALCLLIGLTGLMSDPERMPALADLKSIKGTLTAVRLIRGRQDVIKYEIDVKDEAGALSTHRLRRGQVSEDALDALLNQPVEVREVEDSDVWQLSSGATTLVSYEATRKRRVEIQRDMQQAAPYVTLAGAVLSLLATLWWRARGSL